MHTPWTYHLADSYEAYIFLFFGLFSTVLIHKIDNVFGVSTVIFLVYLFIVDLTPFPLEKDLQRTYN